MTNRSWPWFVPGCRLNAFLPTFSVAVLTCTTALSGEPVEVTLSCPIGGEEFEIVETTSYSFRQTRRMSFAPISTADFVTRLPQCPSNSLPMYREFDEEELAQLGPFLGSAEFQDNLGRSRYWLAYQTERHLGGANQAIPFNLLLDGLWYDSNATFADEDYIRAFLQEAAIALDETDAESRPFLEAILAFVHFQSGNDAEAEQLLSTAKASPQIEIPLLQAYVEQISSCLQKLDPELCSPKSEIQLP